MHVEDVCKKVFERELEGERCKRTLREAVCLAVTEAEA